jgi:hypothetical protein
MQADLIGRIANTRLPNQHALLPVFEAIVNAIHSCNDLGENATSEISVKLIRSAAQSILPGSGHLNAIESFEITDSGAGFNEANYQSFQTADSRYRAKIGGKGIGRFLWLVAFDYAQIESTFVDKSGALLSIIKKRIFWRAAGIELLEIICAGGAIILRSGF